MILRIVFVLISLISFAHADISMRLILLSSEVKQGALLTGNLLLDGSSLQQFEPQQLRGQTVADTVYFQNLGPLMRSADGNYSTQVRFVIAKIPKENFVKGEIGKSEVTLVLSHINITPTEAPQTLIFGTFEIPKELEFLKWIIAITIGLIIIFSGIFFYQRAQKKQTEKKRIRLLKDELLAAKKYDDVVGIWKKKAIFLKDFPQAGDPFKELEAVLFKYQFKSSQSEAEKIEVINAYENFKAQFQGGSNGI